MGHWYYDGRTVQLMPLSPEKSGGKLAKNDRRVLFEWWPFKQLHKQEWNK